MAKLVANRYASALFEVGIEENKIELFAEELKNIVAMFKENEDFFKLLKSPLISKKEKKEIVETVYKAAVCPEVLNFVKILIDKDRLSVIEEMSIEYKNLLNERNNILDVVAISAVALSEKQMLDLKNNLSKVTNKNIEITNEIDENVMGGMLIRLGYEEIDGTVKMRLEELKKELFQIIA